jgi:hypothetical protein
MSKMGLNRLSPGSHRGIACDEWSNTPFGIGRLAGVGSKIPGGFLLGLGLVLGAVGGPLEGALVAAILAGGETDTPVDTPSGRLDTEGEFSFVGALGIESGVQTYRGSGVALSREWVLTAAHNVDVDGDGQADTDWSGTFHLPGYGDYGVAGVSVFGGFSGFGNPVVNDDLALLRLGSLLPAEVAFPILGNGVEVGEVVSLVGFGRSGYGSYGFTSNATLTDRRFGANVIDELFLDDEGSGRAEVFQYDFDEPSTMGKLGGSLGNEVESMIGPGDSGGAAVRLGPNGWELVGINTYTEGYGGRFGDTGGGIVVEPYAEWIVETMAVPEPGVVMLLAGAIGLMVRRSRKKGPELSEEKTCQAGFEIFG